jgi:hypothetical protein
VATGRDSDPDFPKRMDAVDASIQHARTYLDPNERKFDRQWFLPRGYWMETGRTPLAVAERGAARCGSEAISELESGAMYAIQVVMRQSVHCIRKKGHQGVHCSQVQPHQFRKSRWQAYVWRNTDETSQCPWPDLSPRFWPPEVLTPQSGCSVLAQRRSASFLTRFLHSK